MYIKDKLNTGKLDQPQRLSTIAPARFRSVEMGSSKVNAQEVALAQESLSNVTSAG